jgi:6-phosphogluconolactonase
VPDDPILEVTDRQVAITAGEYQGTRRMSLTYKAIDRARQIMFLVTGEGKEGALSKLEAGDPSVPAGRISNPNITLITDIALSGTEQPA